MTMGKTIIIDEQKESELIGRIFESVFYPNVQQVLDVEEYLNKNFRPKKILTTNNITGHSKFKNVVVQVVSGVELYTLDGEELLRLLDDKFNDRIKDDNDRKKFLRQVIDDWYTGKIKNGILSVNHL